MTIKAKFKSFCRRLDSLFLEFLIKCLNPVVIKESACSPCTGASIAGTPVHCELSYSHKKRQTTLVFKPISEVTE